MSSGPGRKALRDGDSTVLDSYQAERGTDVARLRQRVGLGRGELRDFQELHSGQAEVRGSDPHNAGFAEPYKAERSPLPGTQPPRAGLGRGEVVGVVELLGDQTPDPDRPQMVEEGPELLRGLVDGIGLRLKKREKQLLAPVPVVVQACRRRRAVGPRKYRVVLAGLRDAELTEPAVAVLELVVPAQQQEVRPAGV